MAGRLALAVVALAASGTMVTGADAARAQADGPSVYRTWLNDSRKAHIRINGGYFVFRPAIFDYLRSGEELVCEPFQRLIAERRLAELEYDGFWMSMDTFKDRQQLEDIHSTGCAPWQVWQSKVGSEPLVGAEVA